MVENFSHSQRHFHGERDTNPFVGFEGYIQWLAMLASQIHLFGNNLGCASGAFYLIVFPNKINHFYIEVANFHCTYVNLKFVAANNVTLNDRLKFGQ